MFACFRPRTRQAPLAQPADVWPGKLTSPVPYDVVQELENTGAVKLARDRVTGECVAVTCFAKGVEVTDALEKELLLLHELKHPHILQLRQAWLTSSHLCVALELPAGGSLRQRVEARHHLPEPEACWYFGQLVSALEFCHSKGVCHRDLNLDNLMLCASDQLKVCDFLDAKRGKSQPKTVVGDDGTYIAPEVLQSMGTPYDGQLADIWSCGVILYVMLVGEHPFTDPAQPHSKRATFRRMNAAEYTIPPGLGLSREAQDLIRRLLVRTPAQRASLAEVRAHAWLAGGQGPAPNSAAAAQPIVDRNTAEERLSRDSLTMLLQKARSR